MKKNRAGVFVLSLCVASIVESVPSEADAQSAVEDYKATCGGTVATDTVMRYLTGKDGRYKGAILTTSSKTLAMNGPQFSAPMPYDGGDYTSADLVSIPHTTTKPVKVAVDMANLNKQSYEVSVCSYDLKTTAKGWDNFAASDLVATYGRRLKGGSGPMSVTVPVVDTPGTRGSQVILVSVVHFVSPPTVPVFKASLAQTR